MRMNFSQNRLYLSAFMLIVLTTVVILGGVAYNRYSGEPRTIILSERELSLPFYYKHRAENSGLSLRLSWFVLGDKGAYSIYSRQPKWLDSAKLATLGFDQADMKYYNEYGRTERSKTVLIVLEYNGDTYQQALEWARNRVQEQTIKYQEAATPEHKSRLDFAQRNLKELQLSQSRLFAIDAGLDIRQLRNRYADASRYMIVQSVVRPTRDIKGVLTGGSIEHLSIEQFHVSLKHRRLIDTLISGTPKKVGTPPRYEVTLAYGSRLEPWIVSIKALSD